MIQQERVSLPPTLIISMQLLMGVLFGVLGLALATPMAALGLTLFREAYVQRYLGQEARDDGARGSGSVSMMAASKVTAADRAHGRVRMTETVPHQHAPRAVAAASDTAAAWHREPRAGRHSPI
ncbi:MAG: AI-2E family transporter [Rhodoplanes sp.]